MKTVVITGITGKSGRFLFRRLLSEAGRLQNYKFILLQHKIVHDAELSGNDTLFSNVLNAKLNLEWVAIDLKNTNRLETFFAGCTADILLHIAGIKFSGNIVSCALKYGIDNFILVHTTGIYSKYKAAGEEYRRLEASIQSLGAAYKSKGRPVALTILRPTMIYGDLADKNVSVFIKMVDRLRLFPVVGGARYELQPVWCKDLGDAFFDVLMNWDITKNKEYILSGGAPIQLREMFEVIAKQLGVKNYFVSCPFPFAYAGAWLLYIATLTKIDFREKVQRLVEPRAYNYDVAARDFSYSPVAFEIGVRDEIAIYLKHKKKDD